MQLRIGITYLDGSAVDATASTADLVAWERNTSKPLAKLIDERYLGDMLWLAWRVLHRKAQVSLDFDAWLEQVDSMTLGQSDEDSVPLDEAASTGDLSR